MKNVKFAVQLLVEGFSYQEILEIARKVESLGFDILTMPDHFYPMMLPRRENVLESWVTIASLLRDTNKLMIGPLVTCTAYRYPSVLAKMVASLDHISSGRVNFGIGAGWYEEEYIGYGIPFPKPKVRMEMLREAIMIIKKMWTEEKATFEGKYFKIKDAVCFPKPHQKPYPPIMIGTGGEKYGLRVAAELADKWNWFGSPETYRRKVDILMNYCKEVERDFDEITLTWTGRIVVVGNEREKEEIAKKYLWRNITPQEYVERNIVGTEEEVIDKINYFIDELGVREFYTSFTKGTSITELERISRILL